MVDRLSIESLVANGLKLSTKRNRQRHIEMSPPANVWNLN